MPWRETRVMDERARFVLAVEADEEELGRAGEQRHRTEQHDDDEHPLDEPLEGHRQRGDVASPEPSGAPPATDPSPRPEIVSRT